MAFTNIPVSPDSDAAIAGVAADGANGNKYTNSGRENLLIHNPLGASLTFTFVTPQTVDGNAVADLVIGAFTDKYYLVHSLPTKTYNVASGTDQGAVTMTVSGTVTDVKLLVIPGG